VLSEYLFDCNDGFWDVAQLQHYPIFARKSIPENLTNVRLKDFEQYTTSTYRQTKNRGMPCRVNQRQGIPLFFVLPEHREKFEGGHRMRQSTRIPRSECIWYSSNPTKPPPIKPGRLAGENRTMTCKPFLPQVKLNIQRFQSKASEEKWYEFL